MYPIDLLIDPVSAALLKPAIVKFRYHLRFTSRTSYLHCDEDKLPQVSVSLLPLPEHSVTNTFLSVFFSFTSFFLRNWHWDGHPVYGYDKSPARLQEKRRRYETIGCSKNLPLFQQQEPAYHPTDSRAASSVKARATSKVQATSIYQETTVRFVVDIGQAGRWCEFVSFLFGLYF